MALGLGQKNTCVRLHTRAKRMARDIDGMLLRLEVHNADLDAGPISKPEEF